MVPIKKILLGTFLLTISAIVLAQEAGWITSDEGCELWNPAPEPNESASWNGECIGGVAQGHGTVKWFKDGIRGNEVEALYENGVHKGIVTVTYPDGSTYKGFLGENGLRNGYGVLTRPNGEVQSGNWQNHIIISNSNSRNSTSSNVNDSINWKALGNAADAYLEQERRNKGITCTKSFDGMSMNCK